MRSKLPFFVVIGLCVVICLFISDEARNNISKLESENIRLNNEISLVYNNMGIQFDSEDYSLDFSVRVVNLQGDTISLGDVFTASEVPTVVFRYSNSYCLLCVEQEIKNLNNLLSDQSIEFKIIGLTDFNDRAKIRNFARLKSVKFDSYDLVDKLDVPLEQLLIPYLFTVQDAKPFMHSVFVPSKDIPDNSLRYYQIIKHKFSSL